MPALNIVPQTSRFASAMLSLTILIASLSHTVSAKDYFIFLVASSTTAQAGHLKSICNITFAITW